MSGKSISRRSFDASQHAVVDSQLKSLKIITRRLQSALTIHETELHILERLIYKNKNQHRKALFWRNVIEIRRYSERVDNLKLSDDLQLLRSLFYGSSLLRWSDLRYSTPPGLSTVNFQNELDEGTLDSFSNEKSPR